MIIRNKIKATFWLLQLLIERRHSWIKLSFSFLWHALATHPITIKRLLCIDLFLPTRQYLPYYGLYNSTRQCHWPLKMNDLNYYPTSIDVLYTQPKGWWHLLVNVYCSICRKEKRQCTVHTHSAASLVWGPSQKTSVSELEHHHHHRSALYHLLSPYVLRR